jgi:hypothetical protein
VHEWEVIVEFKLVAEADAEWQAWQAAHDMSGVSPADIRVDTGHGEVDGRIRDVRRYWIKKEALVSVEPINRDETDA